MNLKKITFLIVLLAASLTHFAGSDNPVKDFCLKNNIHQKSVIIALSLEDCAICYTPPDELLNTIRMHNTDIPVYVVSDEDMAEVEKNMFRNKFGTHGNSTIFITDKLTYHYMLSEKGGIPSVCCISETGELLAFKHLKHENLDDFFKALKPNFEIFLVNKTELKSSFFSPKKHNGVYYMSNSICLFHPGANAIAKYNMHGENVKNLLIDSLDIDYLQLARHLFPDKIYKSSEKDYKETHPKRSHLIRAINVLKTGQDTLCALMMITSCGDTVLNNKPTKYERGYACAFLFDADLNYLGTKFFSRHESGLMNFYMRGAYSNRSLYLGKYDTLLKQTVMAQYQIKNNALLLIKQFVLPKKQEDKNVIPMIPAISMSRNNVYLSYFKANEKGQVTSIKVFKLNANTGTFSEEITTDDLFWAQMYTTKKENYLLWTIDKDFNGSVKGYNKTTKQVIDSKDKLNAKTQNADGLFFVIDGYLQEYTYSE